MSTCSLSVYSESAGFGLRPKPSRSTAISRYLDRVSSEKFGNTVSVQNDDDDMNPCMNSTSSSATPPSTTPHASHYPIHSLTPLLNPASSFKAIILMKDRLVVVTFGNFGVDEEEGVVGAPGGAGRAVAVGPPRHGARIDAADLAL